MDITPTQQMLAWLRRAKKVLCVTGQHPTGDAVAALLALQKLLQSEGKETLCAVPEGVPQNLTFLPGSEQVQAGLAEQGDLIISVSTGQAQVDRVKYKIEADSVDIWVTPRSGQLRPDDVQVRHRLADFDLILVVGVANLESLGTVFTEHTELFAQVPVVNLAVDPANEFFGRVNVVDPGKSSVCELLFDLVQTEADLSEQLDADLATILLTGIISSTGSFLESTTTAQSLETASKLQAQGARQSDIIEHLYKMKSLATLKVWGRVLSSLQLDPKHRLAWASVAELDGVKVDSELVGTMADDLLRFVSGAELAILLLETDRGVQVQVRTSSPAVDLTKLQSVTQGERRTSGVDIIYPDQRVGEIEADLLRKLCEFQSKRLHLEPSPLERVSLEPTQHKVSISQKTSPPIETEVKPTPPAELPFDAPLQAHEKTGIVGDSNVDEEPKTKEEMPVPPGTQAAEITLGNEQSVPEWMKLSKEAK